MAQPPHGCDVFMSYSRKDTREAALIRDSLVAHGLSVFFDTEGIEGGAEFPQVIDRAVKGAKVVLACWTHRALESRWVRIESRIGLDRGTLVAAAIEPLRPDDLPAEFYNVNVVDLTGFHGREDHPGWRGVLRAIGRKTGRGDLGASGTAAVPMIGHSVPSRPPWKRKLVGALAVIGIVGVGGWYALDRPDRPSDPAATAAAPAPAPSQTPGEPATADELASRIEANIAAADPILRAAAEARIAEIAQEPFPRSVWAAAQLVAASPDLPADVRARYEETIEDVVDRRCRCVVVNGAPLTAVSAWIVLSYTEAGEAPPAEALVALVEGQSRDGWWSGALDADEDNAANASLNATMLATFALSRARERMSFMRGDRDEVDKAVTSATAWLGTKWQSTPLATVLRLRHARGEEARRLATGYLNTLAEIYPPDHAVLSRQTVTRNGEPFEVAIENAALGWQTYGLAVVWPHLSEQYRALAAERLAEAAAHPLDTPSLARQEAKLAEVVLGLRLAAAALRE